MRMDGWMDGEGGWEATRPLSVPLSHPKQTKKKTKIRSAQVKRQVLLSATEAAEMILRVDEVVKAAPRPRERE